MALPTYASPLEKIWHYTYLVICGLIFIFLIAPILVVIPLSFNAEPYFTFTEKMLTFDPEGYSLRWYDTLLTLGHPAAETPRDSTWWSLAWENSTWIQAAKNSFWVGLWATILATTLGIPVSTKHTITGASVGVGSNQRASAVRWGVAGNIVWAWILTIPASAFVAAIAYWVSLQLY